MSDRIDDELERRARPGWQWHYDTAEGGGQCLTIAKYTRAGVEIVAELHDADARWLHGYLAEAATYRAAAALLARELDQVSFCPRNSTTHKGHEHTCRAATYCAALFPRMDDVPACDDVLLAWAVEAWTP